MNVFVEINVDDIAKIQNVYLFKTQLVIRDNLQFTRRNQSNVTISNRSECKLICIYKNLI